MAAADLVVCLPGATTCSEARVVGRPLLLLDVMPGHGHDPPRWEPAYSAALERIGLDIAVVPQTDGGL